MNDSDRSAAGRPGRSSPFPSSSSPFLSPPSQHRNNNNISNTPPLHLTARFLSLPDVQIEIPDPSRVTVVGLKTLIRKQLVRAAAQADAEPPSPASSSKPQRKDRGKEKEPSTSSSPTLHDAHRRRLRIIYAGKILADDVVLGNVLKPVPPPPRAGRSPSVSTSAASTPVGNQSTNNPSWGGADTPPSSSSEAARVYVNCSIGDILPESELTAEADAAAVASAMLTRTGGGSSAASGTSGTSTPGQRGGGMRLDPTHRRGASGGNGVGAGGGSSVAGPSTQPSSSRSGGSTTTPAPRGFERLLQAGFTSAEVNQLRLQFNTIQSTRFTPDTMPSPDSLRTMEDNWLDNNQGGGAAGAGSDNGATPSAFGRAGGGGDDGIPPVEDTGLPGMLDIMVRAMVIGFMFPLGSMGWLMREEGLWTPRWRMFVSMGVVVSFMIGSVKTLAGEW
ncbi:hypothetical protein Sste5346_003307 [Sporothrix stenoceras]|uniref:Ubiquitin-like domain-containing protein n=1 Tax=Sporothrix stenoceras TaxID=5173 RepID=A0ABR3ZDZ9_9PEZI